MVFPRWNVMSSKWILFVLICLLQCLLIATQENITKALTSPIDVACKEGLDEDGCRSTEIPPLIKLSKTLDSVTLPPYARILPSYLFQCTDHKSFEPPPMTDFVRDTTPPNLVSQVLSTKNVVIILIKFNNVSFYINRLQKLVTTMRCYFNNVPFTFVEVSNIDEACEFFELFSNRESKSIYPVIVILPGKSISLIPPCLNFNRLAISVQIILDDGDCDAAGMFLQSRTVEAVTQHINLTSDRTGFDLLAVSMNPFLRITDYSFNYAQLPLDLRGTDAAETTTLQTGIILGSMIGFTLLIIGVTMLVLYSIHQDNRKIQRELEIRKGLAQADEYSPLKNEF